MQKIDANKVPKRSGAAKMHKYLVGYWKVHFLPVFGCLGGSVLNCIPNDYEWLPEIITVTTRWMVRPLNRIWLIFKKKLQTKTS